MDGKDIRIIANLYWMQKAAIRVGDELSDYTEIKRGVRQGCVLSPYLFNIYTEFIFRENSDSQGAIIGGRNISNLRYADDTVLLSEDKDELTVMIKNFKDSSGKAGLDRNASKTEDMVFSKQGRNKATTKVD